MGTNEATQADAAFGEFLAASVDSIPGWLAPEAALLTAHLTNAQRAAGLMGPVLEIGVFQGKYLAVLYRLSQPGEVVAGIDLFIGASAASVAVDTARSNIRAACGDESRLKIVVADSLRLTTDRLRQDVGEALRFVSIDGGHQREHVLHDLLVTTPLLMPGGIMALDDVYNHTTPGVTEGMSEYFFRHRPALAPFAHCYNKLFVTTPDYHGRYLGETMAFLEAAKGRPTHDVTMARHRENRSVGYTPRLFGYEIVPFL